MKITLHFSGKPDFVIDPNLNGVTDYDAPHSGKYVVKSINSITVIGNEHIFICADPKDEPQPEVPENPIPEAPEVPHVA